jgi:hypothetical protein
MATCNICGSHLAQRGSTLWCHVQQLAGPDWIKHWQLSMRVIELVSFEKVGSSRRSGRPDRSSFPADGQSDIRALW